MPTTVGTGLSWATLIAAIILFFLLTVVVGYFVSRIKLVRELEDFLVSGRLMPWPLMVAVLVAAWIYTSSSMGAAESALYYGAAGTWMYSMYGLSIFCVMFAITRFKKVADHLRISTLTEFIQHRFDAKCTWVFLFIIWLGSYLTLMFNVFGAGFVVRGLSLGVVPFWVAVVAIAVITIIYVLWGGYWASSLTSWLLMLLATFAIVSAVPYVVLGAGGIGQVIDRVRATEPAMLNLLNPEGAKIFLPATALYGFSGWAVQEWYQPGVASEGRRLKLGYFIAFLWVFVVTAISGSIGFIGYSLVSAKVIPPPNAPSEILPHVIALFAPKWVGFLIIFLVFGAGSSTVALTAMAQSAILKGGYLYWCSLKGIKPAEEKLIWKRLRIYVLCAITFAAVFGIVFEPSVLFMVLLSCAVFAPLGVPMFLALFWDKVNSNGVFAGAVIGIIAVLVTFFVVNPGFATALGTGIGTVMTLVWTIFSPKRYDMKKLGI